MDYDRQRELDHIEALKARDVDVSAELRRMYVDTMHELEEKIDAWVGRYAQRNGTSIVEATDFLTRLDVDSMKARAKAYVDARDFSKEANDFLEAYNSSMKINAAKSLYFELDASIAHLGDKTTNLIDNTLRASYMDEIRRQSGILGMTTATADELLANATVVANSSLNSVNWSDRVWSNQEDLRDRIKSGVRKSMLQGQAPREWAKSLRGTLASEFLPTKGKDNAIYRTERIAITEAGRVQIEAQQSSYKAMGYDAFEVIAERDGRTCSICALHDGEIVPVANAQMGFNMPMFHPLCRCSTAAVMDRSELDKLLGDYETQNAEKYAEELIAEANTYEQQTTELLVGISESVGGELRGLDYRIKGKERLTEKIRDEAKSEKTTFNDKAHSITDVLRYTIESKDDVFTNVYFDTVESLRNNGYNVKRVRNTFKPNAQYKGVNTLISTPENYVFELQFHTPKSLSIKEKIHVIYKAQRTEKDNLIKDMYSKQMEQMSDAVNNPPNVERIK